MNTISTNARKRASTLVAGDRNVPWANSIAACEALVPLKYEVRVNPEVLSEATEPDRVLRYIDIGNVDASGNILGIEEVTFERAPSRARRLPRAGDTIVSTVRTYLRAIAYVSEDDPDLVCSTGFAVVRPRARLHPKFLAYWLRAEPVVDEICARSTGVSYPAVNASELGALPVPLLPLEQQRRISDFLDRKTASLDTLIAKQEQLLALLAEKRQGLITQAVTKGLDPNAPMKDSGVATLELIPAHWELLKLRRIGRIGQGDAFAHDLQGQEAGEFPWFKVADMNRAGNEIEMVSADNFVDSEVARTAKATIFEPGAVIFPRVGAALLTNKRRLLTRPSIIDDNTYAVVPSERVRSRFLYLSLLLVDMASICSAGLVPPRGKF